MFAWLTAIPYVGPVLAAVGTGLSFAWTYRNEIKGLVRAVQGLYGTIKAHYDKKAIDKKVDDAQKTRNPDAIESGLSGK